MTLGEKLRQLRRSRHHSMEHLSELTGIHKMQIYHYELDNRCPSAYNLIKIANALGYPLNSFRDCEEPTEEQLRVARELRAQVAEKRRINALLRQSTIVKKPQPDYPRPEEYVQDFPPNELEIFIKEHRKNTGEDLSIRDATLLLQESKEFTEDF